MENFIKNNGLEIGFDKVAIAPARRFAEHEALKGWLAQGLHGTMGYMERGAEKRRDPLAVMPEAKSVITCALNYNTDYPYSIDCKEPERGWIARYAWGEDYHHIILQMLEALSTVIANKLAGPAGSGAHAPLDRLGGHPSHRRHPPTHFKHYVDTGPIMERVFAKNSGIGWIGKNTCIIDPKLGSWLFLGVILTDLELDPDPIIPDHCGKCTACIDACPTQAIVEPHKLDARKCISYLTIEHRGTIEPELAKKTGNHIYGCDICQDVCPWNQKSPRTEKKEFQPRAGFFNPKLEDFKQKVEQEYPQSFKNSPLKRAKRDGLLRNTQNGLLNGSSKFAKG